MTTQTINRPAPTAVPAQPLDLVLGVRDATTCPVCLRPMPALDEPRFELETLDGGVLCANCSEKTHRSLRLSVSLLNAALDDHAAGRHQAATDGLNAILLGLEMLAAENGRPVPEPNRATRRRQQRGRRK